MEGDGGPEPRNFQNEIPHTTLFSSLSQVLNCCIKYQVINCFAIAAPCVHSWHSIESVYILSAPLLIHLWRPRGG